MKRSMFPEEGIWLKGNMHCHSTVSDGLNTPEELGRYYRDHGYAFLVITDHNRYIPHREELAKSGLLTLTGVERAISFRTPTFNKNTHIVGIGLSDETHQPYKDGPHFKNGNYSIDDGVSVQQIIDMVRADGQYAIVAHPRGSRLTSEDVLAMEHVQALEVFNSVEQFGSTGADRGDSTELWDELLQRGKHIFAVAGDDTHQRLSIACRGWTMVRAKEKTPEAILDALYRGDFYASCGPEIYDYGIEDGEVYIRCSPCRSIHFDAAPGYGSSFFREDGSLMSEARYRLRGNETYIRATVIDDHGYRAWAQPIWF